MKKEYTEAEIYAAIKSGFENLRLLAREDLKKRWKVMEVSQKYDAGRSLVVMGDVAKNPENYFSRAKTQEAWIGRAEAYANEILPKAQGEAIKRKQEAEAYKVAATSKAEGEAKRFSSIYNAYKGGKLVTSKRLYIETIEDVLKKAIINVEIPLPT